MQENNFIYVVDEAIQETTNVVTLKLKCDSGLLKYKVGQFITVFFPETGHVEGKSYSISSSPSENIISITVKGVGVFSNKLISKIKGDTITASAPYGYFYSESENKPSIFIAGGIGITPFRGMIIESLKINPLKKIVLFYSSKTKNDIIFKNEFDELSQKHKGVFDVKYHITQEDASDGMKNGRIPIKDIIEESKFLSEQEFFICGSIPFVRDFWRGLKDEGVLEETIYTEAFF